jgi:hypothetical protein
MHWPGQVYDKSTVAYHLRLIDLRTRQQTWIQELYFEFRYETNKAQFHYFEADDVVVLSLPFKLLLLCLTHLSLAFGAKVGLAFAHAGDAKKFGGTVRATTFLVPRLLT